MATIREDARAEVFQVYKSLQEMPLGANPAFEPVRLACELFCKRILLGTPDAEGRFCCPQCGSSALKSTSLDGALKFICVDCGYSHEVHAEGDAYNPVEVWNAHCEQLMDDTLAALTG